MLALAQNYTKPPIVFDNTAGQFPWTPQAVGQRGQQLDITAPPSQDGAAAAGFIYQIVPWGLIPTGPTQLISAPLAAGIAVGSTAIQIGTRSVIPALAMNPGDTVGPGLEFADSGVTGGRPGELLLGEHAFVGVEITLADGVHYGWVELQANANPSLGYLPVRWAYEPSWGVPITIPSLTAAAPALDESFSIAGRSAMRTFGRRGS